MKHPMHMSRSPIRRSAVKPLICVVLLAALAPLSLVLASGASATTATNPSLGQEGAFGIFSSTYGNSGATTIFGDLGYAGSSGTPPIVTGSTYVATGPYAQAIIDQGNALATLNSYSGSCDNLGTAVDLSLVTPTGSTPGVYTPGVYCTVGAASTGTGIILNGAGTYIFIIHGALTTVATTTAVTTEGGASACDVFWAPTGATTIAPNTIFAGIDIDASGITIGSTGTWTGKALAAGGTVTTSTETVGDSTCNTPLATTPTPAPLPPTTLPPVLTTTTTSPPKKKKTTTTTTTPPTTKTTSTTVPTAAKSPIGSATVAVTG